MSKSEKMIRNSTLDVSDYVYVKEKDKTVTMCKVAHVALGKNGLVLPGERTQRMIVFKFLRYFYNEESGIYELSVFDTNYTRDDITRVKKTGMTIEQYWRQKDLFGQNIIDVPLKSVFRLLLDEVLHPFFIFQIYSIALWCTEAYYIYAGAILFIATVSAALTLRETRNNLIQLNTIARYTCQVNVLRAGQFELISSEALAPGDVIELTNGLILPCDLTLLSGTVVLNESMLTGESIPVTKYPLTECAGNMLSVDQNVNKRCAMSGGTKVVKIQGGAGDERIVAMVTRTGWATTKGELVLSMLFPKETNFKFFQQSIKFLGVLCSIALVGFGISVWRMLALGSIPASEVVKRALDLITIVVPPALPMAQSVGQGFSIFRLKRRNIFCISPPRVSMGGKTECFCFDKTGTLTEDGLDLLGVVPSNNRSFTPMVKEIDRMTGPLFLTLATCHTLAHIEDKVAGDPLEEKIFEATRAHLDDDHPKYKVAIRLAKRDDDYTQSTSFPVDTLAIEKCAEIGLIERFEFQSALQRMSVIIRGDGIDGQDMALVKGSPEKIKALSVSSSIPDDFDTVLDSYTRSGYRVLACGYKQYNAPANKSKDDIRNEVECELFFLGFIIMENKIKPETPPALQILKSANVRLIMVTGDNVLTAVSVSRECKLVDQDKTVFMSEVNSGMIQWRDVTSETGSIPYKLDAMTLTIDNGAYDNDNFVLAVTGDAWKILYDDMIKNGKGITFVRLLQKGHIFARMTPDQKQNLVEELMASGLYVGMCGDGANDCGALKAAHVGISLSVAEASIAAPFTSTVTNVSCTHHLIREGRASLAVSFKLFQYIGMYSLIQFTSIILLYIEGSVFGNTMYLYQDLWVVFPLVIFMGRTEPCTKLAIKRPSSRLISAAVMGSLFTHVILSAAFQAIIFVFVRKESWYSFIPDSTTNDLSTSLFIFANFQYLIMCFIYSWGKPFLKSIYTNRFLFGCFGISLITSCLLLLLPTPWWNHIGLTNVPVEWRVKSLILVAINSVLSIGAEWIIITIKTQYSLSKRRSKANASRTLFVNNIQFSDDRQI
eukprot:gene11199-13056_t